VKIATWNVNSVRARLERVLAWLDRHEPDLLCLQELKVADDEFPREPFVERGWRLELHGQKTWNGVALVSREPVVDVGRAFPGAPPESGSRAIGGMFRGIRILDVYVPNGQAVGSAKYVMKLAWLDALAAWVKSAWDLGAPAMICGDFNITPEDRDVFDGERHRGKILCSEPEREKFASLKALGFSDAFRLFNDEPKQYTYWDYGPIWFARNLGYRLDHFLVTGALAQRCSGVTVDREERASERPSDHAPVVAEIRDAS
jgi:exodeoxyribonuclease III